MKLLIHELPSDPTDDPRVRRVLRHWLTMPDGELYYQDETLQWETEAGDWSSDRSPWFKLLTPETADVVVAATYDDSVGAPMVFMRSGKAYHFDYRNGDKLPHFYEVIEPVPNTLHDLDTPHRVAPSEIHGS